MYRTLQLDLLHEAGSIITLWNKPPGFQSVNVFFLNYHQQKYKPSAKKGKANDDDESDLTKLFELVAQMNKKLDKLDHIEQHLARVDEDIRDVKQSYTFVHNTTDELAKQQKMNRDALKNISDKVANTEVQNPKLQQDLIDLRARSMRCNLLFYNLPESEQEDPFTIIRESSKWKDGHDENGDIEIERAHRLGRKREPEMESQGGL